MRKVSEQLDYLGWELMSEEVNNRLGKVGKEVKRKQEIKSQTKKQFYQQYKDNWYLNKECAER